MSLLMAGVAGSSAPAALSGQSPVPAGAALPGNSLPGTLAPSAARSPELAGAPGTSEVAPLAGPGETKDGAPFRSVRSYPGVAVPTRLRIPAAGIDTAVERVGLAADGTIAVPSGWQISGWYERGPRPGQAGPAVIVGHVDSRLGPAVFYRLADLRPGDVVEVDRADGTTARFRVTDRKQVPKAEFPVDRVYAPTLQPSLRLMTCGGVFDSASGHYRDNIVVTAVPG